MREAAPRRFRLCHGASTGVEGTMRAKTLGELKQTDYRYRPVKEELRDNLIVRLRSDQPIVPGLVGYETTVVPQLINGVLARHDMLLLGLRGQAKTRILRSLPDLLDEWIPVVDGVEVWDDPLQPALAATRRLIERDGAADATSAPRAGGDKMRALGLEPRTHGLKGRCSTD